MDHSFETHLKHVNGLCRTCGRRTLSSKERSKGKNPYLSANYADLIFLVLNINIEKDEEGKWSNSICKHCVCTLNAIKNSRNESKRSLAIKRATESSSIWAPYDFSKSIEECVTCSHYVSFNIGSIRKKKVNATIASTSDANVDTMSEDTVLLDPSHYADGSMSGGSPELKAEVENQSVSSQVYLPHEEDNIAHLMSLARAIAGDSNENIGQGETQGMITEDTEDACQPNENQSEESLMYDCYPVGLVSEFHSQPSSPEHNQSMTSLLHDCSPIDFSTPQKKSTYTQVTPKKTPPPKQMSVSAVSPILKIRQGQDADTIKFRQKGRETTWIKVPTAQKPDDKVSTRTQRRRKKIIEKVRKLMSESQEAVDDQHAYEIRTMKKDCQKKVLDKARIKRQRKMSVKQALSMKERMGMTYHQLAIQKRHQKVEGHDTPSIHKIRKLAKSISTGHVKVEEQKFEEKTVKKGQPTQIKKVDAVVSKVENIKKFTTQLLDSYDDRGMLTSHDGTIPESQIWIKIGGDHGKGSFKVSLQVCNLKDANSSKNTHLLYMVGVKDTVDNLREIFMQIGDDINSLDGLRWKEKTIILFFCGDYDFLLKVMGLSGAQGTYPCLFCHASKRTFSTKKYSYKPRTIKTLAKDKKAFDEQGRGDKAQARNYNNVIREPLITTNLAAIVPPYLHMHLGLVLRHYNMLRKSLASSDAEISEWRANKERPGMYSTYGQNWEQAVQVEQRIQLWQTCVTFSTKNEDIKHFEQKVRNEEEKLAMLKNSKNETIGPLVSALDKCLTKHKIARQAFHGGAFVGNHCNRYIRQDVQDSIKDTIISTAKSLTEDKTSSFEVPLSADDLECLQMRSKIADALDKHASLNFAFNVIHENISHSCPLNDSQIDIAEIFIDHYMELVRQHDKVTPKSHLLEHHVIPWVRSYKCGMALHGEQGVEQLHSSVAKIAARCRGIRNKFDQQKHILEAMIVHTSPVLDDVMPVTPKRLM